MSGFPIGLLSAGRLRPGFAHGSCEFCLCFLDACHDGLDAGAAVARRSPDGRAGAGLEWRDGLAEQQLSPGGGSVGL
ncbi:MAG: hypothetical protein WCF36_17255 [Candidatus Nanopelagicales bacterium]